MYLGEKLYGVVYNRGETICRQGENGDTLFIIQSGAVEVTRRDKDSELVLALLEEGEFFGEMALLDDYPRSATVKAIRKTRVLPLTRETFLARLREDPGVCLHLIKGISRRIESTKELLKRRIDADESMRWALRGEPMFIENIKNAEKEPGDEAPDVEQEVEQAPGKPAGPEENELAPLLMPESTDAKLCAWREAGEYIYRKGDPGKSMFAIVDGEVEIGNDGDKSGKTVLGAGDFFGQTAMLADLPYGSDAKARSRTCLISINNDDFLDQVQANPTLALYVLRMQVMRLRLVLAALTDPEESMDVVKRCLPPPLKKKERVRVAAASLSACGGCGAALLDNPEELSRLLERVRFVYCPMLMDQSGLEEADVAVIDGVVRVKEDEEKLREIRAKCRFLVAWGSCATIGGIPSMANRYEIEDLVRESYGETLDSYAYYLSGSRCLNVDAGGTGLLRRAYPVDQFVRADYYVSGCPPNIELLGQLVLEITGEPQDKKPAKAVCAECDRKPGGNGSGKLGYNPPEKDDAKVCFLSQGVVCMGSQTQGGCNAVCTRRGMPCWGCRGPAGSVLGRLQKGDTIQDVFYSIAKARAKVDESEVKPLIRELRTRANNALTFQPNLGNDRARVR